jgi:hypothetical protein
MSDATVNFGNRTVYYGLCYLCGEKSKDFGPATKENKAKCREWCDSHDAEKHGSR